VDTALTKSELEEFERPVPNTPIKNMEWSVEKYEVAQLRATKGMTIDRVSEVTGVPVSAIIRWEKHPAFIKYKNDLILDMADTMRAYRLSLCLKMIDARVNKVEEIGDYSLLSTKDTLDILDSMRKDTEKTDDKEQTQYMKTLEALISKSPSTIEISPRGIQ
jgi:DNA-binding transcriptional regulator YiaG